MHPICRNCEYFDCEGKDQNSLPLEYRGDCLNPNAPGFQSGPDETCSFFYADTTRFPERTYTTMADKSIGKCSSGHWLPLGGPCDLCGAGYDEKCRFTDVRSDRGSEQS